MGLLLVLAGGFASILGGFVMLARRMRRRGIGGALMGPIDEIYQPSALRMRQEVQVQAEARATRPSADDRP